MIKYMCIHKYLIEIKIINKIILFTSILKSNINNKVIEFISKVSFVVKYTSKSINSFFPSMLMSSSKT